MVNVSGTKALLHRLHILHIFVTEPDRFSEKFTTVQAKRHQPGNGSRESNEGEFRAFDRPFYLYQDASQFHASRKGWHKKDCVRESISRSRYIVYTGIASCRKRDDKSGKADT